MPTHPTGSFILGWPPCNPTLSQIPSHHAILAGNIGPKPRTISFRRKEILSYLQAVIVTPSGRWAQVSGETENSGSVHYSMWVPDQEKALSICITLASGNTLVIPCNDLQDDLKTVEHKVFKEDMRIKYQNRQELESVLRSQENIGSATTIILPAGQPAQIWRADGSVETIHPQGQDLPPVALAPSPRAPFQAPRAVQRPPNLYLAQPRSPTRYPTPVYPLGTTRSTPSLYTQGIGSARLPLLQNPQFQSPTGGLGLEPGRASSRASTSSSRTLVEPSWAPSHAMSFHSFGSATHSLYPLAHSQRAYVSQASGDLTPLSELGSEYGHLQGFGSVGRASSSGHRDQSSHHRAQQGPGG